MENAKWVGMGAIANYATYLHIHKQSLNYNLNYLIMRVVSSRLVCHNMYMKY